MNAEERLEDLEKRVADLERKVQSQPKEINYQDVADRLKKMLLEQISSHQH